MSTHCIIIFFLLFTSYICKENKKQIKKTGSDVVYLKSNDNFLELALRHFMLLSYSAQH